MAKINLVMVYKQLNRFSIYIIFLLSFYEQVCCQRNCGKGLSQLSREGYIYGGVEAKEGDWPWMVAVMMKNESDTEIPICTGFLIDRKHFLSAAHCFETSQIDLYSARIGHINLEQGDVYNFSRVDVHEGYRNGQFYDDIALITLANEVNTPDFNPICLPPRGAFVNMTGRGSTVAGWGSTSAENDSMSLILKTLSEMPIVSNEKCDSIYRHRFIRYVPRGITSGMVCAGFEDEPGKDSCGGDSGGPLMIQEQNRWYAVGIVSFGILCGRPDYPGVYTRVTKYLEWINQHRRDNSSCPDPGIPRGGNRMFLNGTRSSSMSFRKGESVIFSCTGQETEVSGTPLITCTDDGTWSAPLPRCVQSRDSSTCPDPGTPTGGDRVNADGTLVPFGHRFKKGESIVFSCRGDDMALVGKTLITCKGDATWSSPLPRCVRTRGMDRSSCSHPGMIENGNIDDSLSDGIEQSVFLPGSEIRYSCRNGYALRGMDTIYCRSTGMWSSGPPTCELVPSSSIDCGNLGPISNGRMVVYRTIDMRQGRTGEESFEIKYPVGTQLRYSCEIGYVLNGSDNLVCESSGTWSAEKPVCEEDCGVSMIEPIPKITNGNRTVAAEWPWMVAIMGLTDETKRPKLLCGGALLDRRTVLTTARCA